MAYSFSSVVRYSECDERAQLSIPAMINYLQDCSTFQSEMLGHGVDYLAENHFAWIIAAWDIEVLRLPHLTEPIVTTTWCYGLTATNASRNFTITTPDGEQLVRANSLWLVFDTDRLRPIRIPEAEKVYLSDDELLDMPPMKRKIRLTGEGTELSPIVVTEQHLDTNHHVNNGQYIAFADRIIRQQDEEFATRRINVQYKSMARLGDVIVPKLHVVDGGYAVDLADKRGTTFAIVSMKCR